MNKYSHGTCVVLWRRSSCGSDGWPSISGLHLRAQVNCSINVSYFYFCNRFPIKDKILKMILKEMGHLTNGKWMWMWPLPTSQNGFKKGTDAKTGKRNERRLRQAHVIRVGKDFCASLFALSYLLIGFCPLPYLNQLSINASLHLLS